MPWTHGWPWESFCSVTGAGALTTVALYVKQIRQVKNQLEAAHNNPQRQKNDVTNRTSASPPSEGAPRSPLLFPASGRAPQAGKCGSIPTRQSTRRAAAGGQRRVPLLGIVMRCGPLPWLGHGLRPGTLAQKAVLNVTPDGSEGGIWASDTGPAADPSGSVYVPTGNGTFDAALGGPRLQRFVLQLSLEGSSLVVRDYFTPHDQAQLSDGDADVGSSGPLFLPDQPGLHRHLLLQLTKGSNIYVIDRDRMGKFQPDRDAIVQRIRMTGGGYGAIKGLSPGFCNGL